MRLFQKIAENQETLKIYIIFWQDYPILATVPTTSFSCVGKAEGGYYADVETGCQVKLSNNGNHNFNVKSNYLMATTK